MRYPAPYRIRWLLVLLLAWPFAGAEAQGTAMASGVTALPPAFLSMGSSRQKALYLQTLITDSLAAEQYQSIIAWARMGLVYAQQAGMDSTRGRMLKYIGEVYGFHLIQPDSAIWYYQAALRYFPDKLDREHIFLAGELLNNYSDLGNRDSTFVYLNYLKTIMDALPDTAAVKIDLAKQIAGVYGDCGMFEKAIHYYQFAMEGCLRNRDRDQLGLVLVNLGLVYNELQNDEKAIRLTRESLQYMEGHKKRQIKTCANLAAYYCNTFQFDSARYYLERSNALARSINDSSDLHTNATRLASIYIRQKQYGQAQQILDGSLSFFQSRNDHFGVIKTLFYLGELDTARRDYPSAKRYFLRAAGLSRQADNKVYLSIALQDLTNTASAMGDYRQALIWQKEFMDLQDSTGKAQVKDALYEMEISYQTRQKEQQIRMLTQDNRIKSLQLENNRRSVLVAAGGAVLLLLILGYLYRQKSWRNRIQLEKVQAQLETRVLRAQMNPHFIFNCLNSIENFMMRNDKRKASDYFGKFALLIRMILDSSRNEWISLAKDMEALDLYVELEQLRFNHKFTWIVDIDPQLESGEYKVPPLLIQPYVENAILHGLAQSEKEMGQLQLRIRIDGDMIEYRVRDNGIGRERSRQFRSREQRGHASVGMQLTRERILLLNAQRASQGDVQITDLYEADGQPAGTEVRVTIKML